MDLTIDGEGVWMELAGAAGRRRCEAGWLMEYMGHEFFVPATAVTAKTEEALEATIEGIKCAFDLRSFGHAEIVDNGTFFTIKSGSAGYLRARHRWDPWARAGDVPARDPRARAGDVPEVWPPDHDLNP